MIPAFSRIGLNDYIKLHKNVLDTLGVGEWLLFNTNSAIVNYIMAIAS